MFLTIFLGVFLGILAVIAVIALREFLIPLFKYGLLACVCLGMVTAVLYALSLWPWPTLVALVVCGVGGWLVNLAGRGSSTKADTSEII